MDHWKDDYEEGENSVLTFPHPPAFGVQVVEILVILLFERDPKI